MISFALEIILGDDLFFACVRASFGAALALARVRQCVRSEGLRCGARAAFWDAARYLLWSSFAASRDHFSTDDRVGHI